MTQNRYDGLKIALYEHIQQKKFRDDCAVLTWLISRLDEWVERLSVVFSWQRIPQTDFFRGLTVNIEMIDEVKSDSEFKQSFPEQAWTEFRNAVTWLEKTRDPEELSLVKRTYHQFKNRFAEISGQNSDSDQGLETQSDSKATWTDEKESLDQGGRQNTDDASRQSQIEWWPSSTLRSPIVLRTSRVILSLAILLLLGSVVCFVYFLYEEWVLVPVHFGALEGFRSSPEESGREIGNLTGWCFLLSVLFFSVWAAYRLCFKVRRKWKK